MYNKNQGNGKFKGIYTPIIIKYHRGKLNPITKTHHAKYTAKKNVPTKTRYMCNTYMITKGK